MKKTIIACAVVLAACLSSCGDTNYCYEVTTKFPTLTGGTDEEKIYLWTTSNELDAWKEKYIKLVLATITSLIMLYIFFILYPSKVIRPDINSYNDLTTFILYIVYKVDSPTNCFPSGHCLLCFTLIYSLLDNQTISNKLKMPALIINILIIMSTLFVKQHVILDVISAFALATINYYFTVNLKFFNQIKKKMKSHT